jgi:hypothetical protein
MPLIKTFSCIISKEKFCASDELKIAIRFWSLFFESYCCMHKLQREREREGWGWPILYFELLKPEDILSKRVREYTLLVIEKYTKFSYK